MEIICLAVCNWNYVTTDVTISEARSKSSEETHPTRFVQHTTWPAETLESHATQENERAKMVDMP